MFWYVPVESKEYPGFYNIPGYSNYCIAVTGELKNKTTGRSTFGFADGKPDKNGNQYYHYSLINDRGEYKHFLRHRLLALIFKYPGINFPNLIINHIDGIKGHDDLENIEWVTQSQNAHHAHELGLISKYKVKRPISVRDIDTGEVTKFPNLNNCARYYGLSVDNIRYRYNGGELRLWPERRQYRAGHGDEEWILPDDIEKYLLKNAICKRILVRNVLTEEIHEFDKMVDLADYLNVSPSVVTMWAKLEGQPLLPGYVQLKFAYDDKPWRKVVDHEAELAQFYNSKRRVKCINTKTNETKIYQTCADCADANGILRTTLNWRLKKPEHVWPDGCTFSYV